MGTILPSHSVLLPNRPWNRYGDRNPRTLTVVHATGGVLPPEDRLGSLPKPQHRLSLNKSVQVTRVTQSRMPAGEEGHSEEELTRVRNILKEQALISAFEEGGGGEGGEGIEEAKSPSDPRFTYEERERNRMERRKQGMQEYEELKRELEKLTLGIGALGGTYCFFVLSLQAAVSYSLGVSGSYVYLQLLYREADQLSADNVPNIFRRRRRTQSIGITSQSLQENAEKIFEGSRRALSSPRLVIPSLLMGVWAVSKKMGGEDSPESFHLQLAPLILGFLVYKAAALVQTYRDNKDLLS